jgi:cyanophycinase
MLRGFLAVGAVLVLSLHLSPARERSDRTGALLLVGGGTTTQAVKRRFLELAGGRGAHLVVIPSASALPEAGEMSRRFWAQEGVPVLVLHTTNRAEADAPGFCRPLRRATGVWIPGGDQARFMALYGGTQVEREIIALYRRGGVIGGTSAGASVASRVMPDEEGEGRGLGLLDGVIVDQHFNTRARLGRLLHLLGNHPDQLGLGLDEGTGVVIRAGTLTVVGEGTVSLCRVGLGPQVYRSGETVALVRPAFPKDRGRASPSLDLVPGSRAVAGNRAGR